MRFYDMLQLDPAGLKSEVCAAETVGERRKLQAAMTLRAILLVVFAIIFIAPVGTFFGSENNPMGVALFCILLAVRFVDFGYCIKDSMLNLAVTFALILVAPVLTAFVNPVIAACIHFAAFFTILLMASDSPEMGNGGLYGFAYVFLTGNPVTGELFWKRAALTLVGYLICGTIFYVKHRKKNIGIRFRQIVSQFNMSKEKGRWQLRMALGVSLVLTLGNALHLERFMWMGFACASLLSTYPYTANIKERVWQRILGVVVGSVLFFGVYQVVPESMHGLLGPAGGLCLGFCTDYRYKTTINCFGALMLAAGIYGVQDAVLLRIQNNLLGVILGFTFIWLYQKVVDKRFEMSEMGVQQPTTEL